MPLTFANLAGLWALLAIPAILLIHFLQRESRRETISTLFLLEQIAPVSAQGRRFERLRNSIPLWLQLLAALLVTWMLVQPRWLRRDSVQSIAVVLDSSVSMRAFREPMEKELALRLADLSRAAATTEWRLMETDTTRPALYSGGDLAALRAALSQWQPHLGTHDVSPALRVAQGLVRGNGIVVFVSDRAAELPPGVRLFAVGAPFDNCGFAGLTATRNEWRVLVQNHGATTQTRTWSMEAAGQKSPPAELTIAPGQTQALAGTFPAGTDRCELVLSPDLFPLDDRLPIVRPEPKPLTITAQAGTPFDAVFAQLIASVEHVATSLSDPPDLHLAAYDPLRPQLPDGAAIVFVAEPGQPAKYLGGLLVSEDHPLTAELSWQGLLCRETLRVTPRDGDEVLVWQGERALLFLRGAPGRQALVVNFDVRHSNALKLPAFVLSLTRYVEAIRANKAAPETANFELNQPLELTSDPTRRAPSEPGFFEAPLLRAAAHFADAREGNFRDAAAIDLPRDQTAKLGERSMRADFLAPLWALILAAALLGNWIWSARA